MQIHEAVKSEDIWRYWLGGISQVYADIWSCQIWIYMRRGESVGKSEVLLFSRQVLTRLVSECIVLTRLVSECIVYITVQTIYSKEKPAHSEPHLVNHFTISYSEYRSSCLEYWLSQGILL